MPPTCQPRSRSSTLMLLGLPLGLLLGSLGLLGLLGLQGLLCCSSRFRQMQRSTEEGEERVPAARGLAAAAPQSGFCPTMSCHNRSS